MKELVYLHPILCVASKFALTSRQSNSSVEENIANYWPEICKLLSWDKKNVVLYTVTI